jgi:hypothetical protein
MRALTLVAVGVALVGLEFRLDAPDVLVDPLGWLLIAGGAWWLAVKSSAVLALLAAPLSAAGAYLSFRTVLVDTDTDAAVRLCPAQGFCYEQVRYDDLGGLRSLALLGAALAGGAALTWLLRVLRTDIGDVTKQVPLRRQLQILEVVVPVVWFLPIVARTAAAVLSGDGYDPVWNEGFDPLIFARVAVVVWLVTVLLMFSDRYPRPVRNSA